ncbi:hypothetical protein [Lentilactobacillus kefiri]|uniref:Uncharacterized protein n=1 Tax=Lentilactobacillus kefiri TaxID=33962 RepID=A0A511DWS3_LENKE|nr:hypothetical protein [Lentilactobacillus kefiri]GEL29279.1 hypothetical protein LKE01_20990 [Lentilactobacillus kefiri]
MNNRNGESRKRARKSKKNTADQSTTSAMSWATLAFMFLLSMLIVINAAIKKDSGYFLDTFIKSMGAPILTGGAIAYFFKK